MVRSKHIIFLIIWICFFISAQAQVTFVIKSLPNATPEQDTIFLTGSFNNWAPNDPRYMLSKQVDGHYAITLPPDYGTIEFKFTRGNWMKVETTAQNDYMPNRSFTFGNNEIVNIYILNWQDLGGAKKVSFIVFYMFAMAFQAVILILIISKTEKKDPYRSKIFYITNGLLLIMFGGLVWFNLANEVVKSYLTMIVHIILFLWGPLLYLFINSLKEKNEKRLSKIFFLPAFIIVAIIILRVANLNSGGLNIFMRYLNPSISVGNVFIVSSGLIFNLYFLGITGYKENIFKPKKNWLKNTIILFDEAVWYVNAGALFVLFLNLLIVSMAETGRFAQHFHPVFLILSIILYIEMYFLWKYPELLRNKTSNQLITEEEMKRLIRQLEQFMRLHKPFKNSDLNIAELSEMLSTKPHVLSKVINEVSNKNFRDFVNTYRVEEFIKMAKSSNFKNYTYLALAHEAGFNSKSTFNLAFKKVTNQSPSEYFKTK